MVDAEIALSLVDDLGENILSEWSRLRGRDGREVCFIAAVPDWAREAVAEEIDASEYGMGGRPMNRKQLEALRLVRSERAGAQAEMHRKARERH